MKAAALRRHGSAALTGVFLLLLSGLSTATFGQDDRDPQDVDLRRACEGDERFDLTNLPRAAAAAAVAMVDRVLALVPSRLLLPGGNKVFVDRVFIGEKETIDVGIIVDDGVPF